MTIYLRRQQMATRVKIYVVLYVCVCVCVWRSWREQCIRQQRTECTTRARLLIINALWGAIKCLLATSHDAVTEWNYTAARAQSSLYYGPSAYGKINVLLRLLFLSYFTAEMWEKVDVLVHLLSDAQLVSQMFLRKMKMRRSAIFHSRCFLFWGEARKAFRNNYTKQDYLAVPPRLSLYTITEANWNFRAVHFQLCVLWARTKLFPYLRAASRAAAFHIQSELFN